MIAIGVMFILGGYTLIYVGFERYRGETDPIKTTIFGALGLKGATGVPSTIGPNLTGQPASSAQAPSASSSSEPGWAKRIQSL